MLLFLTPVLLKSLKELSTTITHKSLKFTDSQIVLHLISNDERPLKKWVRNKVIEIKRIAKVEEWYYVDSAANMIADILAQEKEVQYKISKKIQTP